MYRNEKKYEASQNILQNLTVDFKSKQNPIAWFQLGLSYLEEGDYENAINNLQAAVRIKKTNPV